MTINYEQAVTTLKEIATENPDYVYEMVVTEKDGTKCAYGVDENTPSCIVGHLIYRLEPEKFKEVVRYANYDSASNLIKYREFDLFDTEDRRLYYLLSFTQDAQDTGSRWERAVEVGIEESLV